MVNPCASRIPPEFKVTQPERETVTITHALQIGVAHHQAGRLAEAERAYQHALQLDPSNPVALHLLGIIAHQAGKNEISVQLIDRALAVKPDFDEALYSRGLVLQVLGRHEEALASYDRALAITPGSVETLFNRGNVLLELRRNDEALASYDRVLAIYPEFAEALSNRGNALHKLKRVDEALASYDRALAIRPDHAEVWSNRGNALLELRRAKEALASCDRALAIRPDFAHALNNRGLALCELKRYEEALACYDRALAISPDHAEAWSNRGNLLKETNRYEEALASYERSLVIRPDVPESLSNRGLALHELARYEEAIASYDRALAIGPDIVDTWRFRGAALQRLNRQNEALASYGRALAINPDCAEVHWNEGNYRLLLGDYGRGWEKFEWRLKCDEHSSLRRNFLQPLWLGKEDIAGKTILLHAEQGLGDTIQYLRYVPLVAARGATVFLEVPKVMVPLMTGLAGPSRILAAGESLPEADFHAPLPSLPFAFKTTLETVPSATPYLSVESATRSGWRKRLAGGDETLVGLCWRGNPNYKADRERSVPFASLVPLLASRGVRFISLQKELDEKEHALTAEVENFSHPGEDFKSTAEMIAALDLVISVDTVWAHWAGAIGRPVWVLLPFTPHYIWMLDRQDSPWYPTARLFRQEKAGNWDNVIGSVVHDLKKRSG